MSEARVAIRRALEDPAGAVIETGPVVVRSRAYLIGAFALGLLVSGIAVWSLKPSDALLPDVVRFSHVLPPGQRLAQSSAPISIQFDVAPDGQVVYAANEQLYIRRPDELQAFAIPGSGDDPMTPTFSPDGQWIAYWSRMTEELRKIPAAGGTAERLVSVPPTPLLGGPSGISWDTDGTLVYTTPEGIWTVPAGGGEAQLRLPSLDDEVFILSPQFLPGQTRVLYSEVRPTPEGARARVRVASLDDGERMTLFEGAYPRYLDTGHLVYTRENALFSTRFDPVTLDFEAPSRQLAGVFRTALGFVSYAVSDDGGTLALAPAPSAADDPAGGRTIVWLDHEGVEDVVPVEPGSWQQVRVSPSGTQLALRNGNQQIYTWRVDTGPLRAFAQSPTPPVWLNDEEMVFLGPEGIVRRSLDSSERTVVASPETLPSFILRISSFSLSENALVLEFQEGGRSEIQLLPLNELRYQSVIEGPSLSISDAHLSRDGSYMALLENTTEIMIREFPDVQAMTVSVADGIQPLWTGAGIYYQDQGALWFRSVETRPELELGPPERLVGMEGYAAGGVISGRSWDVAPDGRLIVVKLPEERTDAETQDPPADPERQEIYIVVNFDRELLEQVPLP